MDLPPDIALRRLTYDAAQRAAWEASLPAAERAALEGFGHDRRRRQYVMGRACARTLLARPLGTRPEDVPLSVAPDGAVDVERPGWHVSIAHSGDRAAAAAARRPVGVDLEQVRPRHPELYRYVLHPDEYGLLDRLGSDRNRAHILCWTLKEAVLKGLRTGLRLSPKKLRLYVDPAAGAARVDVEGTGPWELRYAEEDGYLLAVAFRGASEG